MAKKSKPTIALPEFVSLPEAATLANVSERHMRLLADTGKIPAAKVGRNWLVSRAAAVAFKRHPTLGRPKGT